MTYPAQNNYSSPQPVYHEQQQQEVSTQTNICSSEQKSHHQFEVTDTNSLMPSPKNVEKDSAAVISEVAKKLLSEFPDNTSITIETVKDGIEQRISVIKESKSRETNSSFGKNVFIIGCLFGILYSMTKKSS